MRGILALIVILLGFPPASAPGQAQTPAPRIEATETRHDFGAVARGAVVKKVFVIRNQGTAPLVIRRADISTPNLKIRVTQQIEPGAAAELELLWDTSQMTRDAEGQVVLQVNDPRTPRMVFTLAGTVISPIDVLPLPAFYLSQFMGEAVAQDITIRSNQARDLTITQLEPHGRNFSLALEPVEPGKSFRLTATGAPSAPIGRHEEYVIVHTDDPARPRLRIEVNLLVKPDVFVTTPALDFGQISLGALRRSPAGIDPLAQSFLVATRLGAIRILRMESDVPFLRLRAEYGEGSNTVRVNVGIDAQSMAPGQHDGRVRLFTDDKNFPELSVPVKALVTQ